MDHEALRREYRRATLRRADLDPDPFAFFRRWFKEAEAAGLYLPDAMTLATVDAEGAPNARMVVLRGADEKGFVFYTSRASAKGRELEGNPRAALVFHWNELERQVRARGPVERLRFEESALYFGKRPRESQISAAISPQSEVVPGRELLEARAADLRRRIGDGPVPVPPAWAGYRIAATEIEFWQGRESRLHDRFRYARAGGGWRIDRLAP
ncbi:MAG: pyridoxamine 5'-phosphate oxidase [Planctomycetes bacterium]|nr:pyridoxamine 5'-phosphate oxidase [Planctomycetota bacterium]